jgi:thioesterase domain-containing protein
MVAALGIPGAAAQTAKPAPHAAAPHAASSHAPSRDDASHPHVYLMRGLLNIFSLGMDQLAAQVARNGIDASVYNHSVQETVVGAIVQKYRAGDHGPYILVGHSLGADAVMLMAQQLNAQGVPVALVVPFDGTESYTAPANVGCVVNLTQRRYAYMQAAQRQCVQEHCAQHCAQGGNFAEERRAGQERKERRSSQDGITGQGHAEQ